MAESGRGDPGEEGFSMGASGVEAHKVKRAGLLPEPQEPSDQPDPGFQP